MTHRLPAGSWLVAIACTGYSCVGVGCKRPEVTPQPLRRLGYSLVGPEHLQSGWQYSILNDGSEIATLDSPCELDAYRFADTGDLVGFGYTPYLDELHVLYVDRAGMVLMDSVHKRRQPRLRSHEPVVPKVLDMILDSENDRLIVTVIELDQWRFISQWWIFDLSQRTPVTRISEDDLFPEDRRGGVQVVYPLSGTDLFVAHTIRHTSGTARTGGLNYDSIVSVLSIPEGELWFTQERDAYNSEAVKRQVGRIPFRMDPVDYHLQLSPALLPGREIGSFTVRSELTDEWRLYVCQNGANGVVVTEKERLPVEGEGNIHEEGDRLPS